MAEMASRIASLERSLAQVAVQKEFPLASIKPSTDEQNAPKDLLLQKGSANQYLNEILVTRVIVEDGNLASALEISQSRQTSFSPSPFDAIGIMSSPCYSQHPSAFHPPKATAIKLWRIYLNNVEIILGLKLTHVPSDEVRVYSTIHNPTNAKLDDLAFCYSIYFAATVSLEESIDTTAQLQRYKAGIEQACAYGDFFNRPSLTGLRALAIYLSAIRVRNRGKSVWILNGLLVRVAQSLGLHKDGTKLSLSPFDSELRRRLWWHIITRDSRSGEDYGLEDPNNLISTSDVKLPLNVYDADIYPEMEAMPAEKPGWTDMTFSLTNIDLAKATEKLRAGPPSATLLNGKWRDEIIQEAHTKIKTRLDNCNAVTPHQRLTVHCSEYLLRKLTFVSRQQCISETMVTILVTGANRGIGYAIVQAIATRLASSTIILGCRKRDAAQEAIESLRNNGVTAQLDHIELDIESDISIEAAVTSLERRHGKLDVLINNAGKVEKRVSDKLADIRAASNSCFNNLITSNAIVTHAFSKLLRKSSWPRVIMISSARGSISRTTNKELPPVANIDYCVSKVGLNMLMLHLQNAENYSENDSKISFWAISPGHCKTSFNGYRGKKDPLEGAEVVVRLLEAEKGQIESGTFWEYESGIFGQVPW
ncbi:hypothetical protein FBEOM_4578 [Fusarium beomiforme]|uniref:Xylanolytic transcriptional activator regulatory domain-containing protein n=1 Tax=Fusarium beomiforme TaxID=44412 RepID=A0A9P5E0W2_9HYPO|nr:hypothetical protein FBEOM_4578 [Fusarium beomiforme]